MPSPFPVACSEPLEACFLPGAFPVQSFQPPALFGRAYPLATPLLVLHTSLLMNRLADRYPLLIDSLYDPLYKKIQFQFFLHMLFCGPLS